MVKGTSDKSAVDNPNHQHVILHLGGKDNEEIGVPITMHVDTRYANERNTLNELVACINTLYFHPHELQITQYDHRQFADKCDGLVKNISALLQLECVAASRKLISKAADSFLHSLLGSMQRAPLQPGDLGYLAYQDSMKALHDATLSVKKIEYQYSLQQGDSHEARHASAHEHSMQNHPVAAPSIVPPIINAVRKCPDLPQNFNLFMLSIDNTDACKTNWERHFRRYDKHAELLSQYFSMQLEELHVLRRSNPEYAQWALNKIEHFVASLRKRNSSQMFGIEIMAELSKVASSPLPVTRRSNHAHVAEAVSAPGHNHVKPVRPPLLPVNHAWFPPERREHQINTQNSRRHTAVVFAPVPVFGDMRVVSQPSQVVHRTQLPPTNHELSPAVQRDVNTDMFKLKNELNRALEEVSSVKAFKKFQHILGRVLTAQGDADTRAQLKVVDDLMVDIARRSLGTDRSSQIMSFLLRCQTRIKTPLSTQAAGSIEVLKAQYKDSDSPRERDKFRFLQQFEDYIVHHPEISYKDCLRHVKGQLHMHMQLSQQSWLLVQHRFNDVINDIIHDKSDEALHIHEDSHASQASMVKR